MKRFLIAAILIGLLPASAQAQLSVDNGSDADGPMTVRTDKESKQDKAIDKEYQDAMKRSGAKAQQPATADPWGSLRPADNASAKKQSNK